MQKACWKHPALLSHPHGVSRGPCLLSSPPEEPAEGGIPTQVRVRALNILPTPAHAVSSTDRLLLLSETDQCEHPLVPGWRDHLTGLCVPSRPLPVVQHFGQPISVSVLGAEVSVAPSLGLAQAGARCWLYTHTPPGSLLVWGDRWPSCTSAAVSVAGASRFCLLPAHPQTRPAAPPSSPFLGRFFFPVFVSAPGSAACRLKNRWVSWMRKQALF